MKKILILIMTVFSFLGSKAQVDDSQLGAWYMLFGFKSFNENWGIQGDLQYRNWNVLGDLEQMMSRAGIYYKPDNTNLKLVGGYANIQTGEFGDSKDRTNENRIFQDAFLGNRVAPRLHVLHRLRYEQRWREDKDFATRYRYALFLNVPFNSTDMSPKTVYLSLYDEIFINGQAETNPRYDRNRAYAGMGYVINKDSKVQLGCMVQNTNTWSKPQLQFSLIQNF